MNNEKMNQMIDEVYKSYRLKRNFQINQGVDILSQEEFITKCKTDVEFSERWGLKIEERELSEDERNEIRDMQYLRNNLHKALKGSDTKIDWENIPTKLITITYNNETIESYE